VLVDEAARDAAAPLQLDSSIEQRQHRCGLQGEMQVGDVAGLGAPRTSRRCAAKAAPLRRLEAWNSTGWHQARLLHQHHQIGSSKSS